MAGFPIATGQAQLLPEATRDVLLAVTPDPPGSSSPCTSSSGGRQGLDVTTRPDEAGLLWDKMCFLAPGALLTTSAAAPLGVVRDQRGDELRALIEEVAEVALGDGAEADADKVCAFTQERCPRP